MGKADHKWSTQDCLDQTKTMDLTIDQAKDSARNNGQPPAAVLVSRFIQAIVRRCPNLDITLRFAHCQCAFAPVSALCSETFPRVTKLILYVGRHDPEGTHGRARTSCAPNAKFWRPLVNGMSFPDCLNLEIRHYWASSPPAHASLDLRKRYSNVSINYGNSRIPQQRGFFGGRRDFMDVPLRADQIVGPTRGLKQFQSVILECPPELDSPLLMQLLGNPDSVAVNLAKLELRFCNLDYETISMLLYHAPPNLKHLVLLCWDNRDLHGHGATECPHLCPLIRDFSKKLDHLEFAASTVCRELFFDDREIQSLNKNGITTGLGSGGGAIEGHDKLDVHAIRETVEDCRRQKRLKYRTSRIEEAVTAAKARIGAATATSSLFGGGAGANLSAARAQREAEVLLDEEEEQRSRSIERSKRPWFRRIITWHGLCHPNDTWEEVQLAAGMEETGVEWVVVSKFPIPVRPSGLVGDS